MKKLIFLSVILFFNYASFAEGYDVFGIGLYDVKFDGSQTNEAADFRYERRMDYSLLQIGPEDYDFFNLKPLVGIETTSDSATYIIAGVYLEDNVGTMFSDEPSNLVFVPSFGAGYYDKGSGKDLGNNIEFRTTFELAYKLKNNNRIGISFGHISNANLGDKNPGVEILSLSYQISH